LPFLYFVFQAKAPIPQSNISITGDIFVASDKIINAITFEPKVIDPYNLADSWSGYQDLKPSNQQCNNPQFGLQAQKLCEARHSFTKSTQEVASSGS